MTTLRDATGPSGLSGDEVAARVAAGQVNDVPARHSRSLAAILRGNLLTRFNAILCTLLVVILVIGPIQDALFGIVLVSNAVVGIGQELRAKRALDRLTLLSAPRATVVRDGAATEVDVHEVVLDDIVAVGPGDQVVVDGVVVGADGLEVDESLLSGESEPVVKQLGDEVLSASFVAAGTGHYRATRVGREAYAETIAAEASRFSLVRSELRAGIDRILRWVTWLIGPTAGLLIASQMTANEVLTEAIRGSVAGVGAMIPEGLVLLTSVAFAVGVVRLGRRRVLVQELPALEGLARVDVVCIDKTGTLTVGDMAVHHVEHLTDGARADQVLGALAAADGSPNASMRAVAAAFPAPEGWAPADEVPFSSARKWSAVAFDAGRGSWVLGAPDIVLAGRPGAADALAAAEKQARSGRRVLVLASSAGGLDGTTLPDGLEPVALVVLEERLRPSAAATLAYLAHEGVAVKVISGDDPRTVAAVARRLGLDVRREPLAGPDLPDDADALADAVEAGVVFGRITPRQKRAMVAALQRRGHVVAMTGDGVNDVLALKDADIGVAMGAGSPAARAVAQLVLLDNDFAAFPPVVAEGRRVIANVERVANLFVTKTVYATLLALAVGVARLPFPFYPRQLTIVSTLTIGIPAFFLALAPNGRRAEPGFVHRVLRFAVPTGVVAAVATFTAYVLARIFDEGDLTEARTLATVVLFSIGLWALAVLAGPSTPMRLLLVAAMGAAFLVVLLYPPLRDAFALDPAAPKETAIAVVVVSLAALALEGGWGVSRWRRG